MGRLAKFDEFNNKPVLENDDPGLGMDQEAFKKMTRAKILLLAKAAFFGQLAVRLEFKEDRNLPYKTMATDGLKILYDPDFVKARTDEEIRWVICHEIMHCALYHFLRKQANPTTWNAAADYAINQLIDPNKYDEGDYKKAIGKMPEGGLLDKKYEGWSAEQIYQHLIENDVQLPPEEGWNYGNVEPPVFVPSTGSGDSDGGDEDFGEKAKIGDYVTLPDGSFGEITGIDPATGDADITPISEADLKNTIESQTGREVLKIR